MPCRNSWDVIFGGDSDRLVPGVDFRICERRLAGFAELAARMESEYNFLQVKPSAVRTGRRPSSNEYIGSLFDGTRVARHPLRAVLGFGVGSVYAAPIAEGISWQMAPMVISFDPQLATMELLSDALHRKILANSALFSDDEIVRARRIADEVAKASAGDMADIASEMIENYVAVIEAPPVAAAERDIRAPMLVEVISPQRTQRRLAEAFTAASAGRDWHGNIPL
jgi:hypothetical protein